MSLLHTSPGTDAAPAAGDTRQEHDQRIWGWISGVPSPNQRQTSRRITCHRRIDSAKLAHACQLRKRPRTTNPAYLRTYKVTRRKPKAKRMMEPVLQKTMRSGRTSSPPKRFEQGVNPTGIAAGEIEGFVKLALPMPGNDDGDDDGRREPRKKATRRKNPVSPITIRDNIDPPLLSPTTPSSHLSNTNTFSAPPTASAATPSRSRSSSRSKKL